MWLRLQGKSVQTLQAAFRAVVVVHRMLDAWLVNFLARPVVNYVACVLILAAVIYCGIIGEPFMVIYWAVIGAVVELIPGFLDRRDER